MHVVHQLIACSLLALAAVGTQAQQRAPSPAKSEDALVCAAAIQTLLGKPYLFLRSADVEGIRVQQFRSSDGLYANSCYLQNTVVVWRTDKSPSHSKPGRWRTHTSDEKVTWARKGDQISIGVSTGTGPDDSYQKTYVASKLRKASNLP